MSDRSGKTEEPTQRRLEKARKEGQFPNAKEFVSALQFIVFLSILSSGGASWFRTFSTSTRSLFQMAFTRDLRPEDVTHLSWKLFQLHFLPLVTAGAAIAITTLAFRLTTTGFGLSLKKLAPDAQRFNVLSKLQELPKQGGPAVIQAIIMLPVFLWCVWVIARDKLEIFLTLPLRSVESGFDLLTSSLMELFWKAAGVFMVYGAIDLFRQLKRHKGELKMSKQEIKEEMKEMEGNPQMKGKIRRLQRDRARRQMMKEVPTATAVIVNPTHFAVAIRYHLDSPTPPLVVAKGKNYLALRIRARATENQVPIIENPPLARALYESVDVGQEIPENLYRAVAEILAYVFKLMNTRTPG